MIKLECNKIKFFSPFDKEFFFERVAAIPAIKEVEVRGKDIIFYVKSKRISYDNLTKIVSLFERYKINRDQLVVFVNDNNRNWMVYHVKGVCRSSRGIIRFPQGYGLTSYLNEEAVPMIRDRIIEAQLVFESLNKGNA